MSPTKIMLKTLFLGVVNWALKFFGNKDFAHVIHLICLG